MGLDSHGHAEHEADRANRPIANNDRTAENYNSKRPNGEDSNMWGAVIGDIAGSRFEGSRGGPKDFEFFHRLCTYTDDTVCTAAIAYIIVNDRKPDATLQRWCRRHPDRGYGGAFRGWIASAVPVPYGSFGNCGARGWRRTPNPHVWSAPAAGLKRA